LPRRSRSPDEQRRLRRTTQWDKLDHEEISGRWALEVQAGLERGWDADYGLGWELRREWTAMSPGPERERFYVKAQLCLLEERCGVIPGGPRMERPCLPTRAAARWVLMDAEKEERVRIEGQAATGSWGASVIRHVKANLPPGPDQQREIAKAQLQLLRIMLGEPAASTEVCEKGP